MKIVLFSLPAHGHTNPTLALTKELIKRGHTVIYFSTEEFKEKVVMSEAIYKSYDPRYLFDPQISKNISDLALKVVIAANGELPRLIKILEEENPDIILYDTVAKWGKFCSKVLNIPTVCLFTTFAFNKTITLLYFQMTFSLYAKALLKPNTSIQAIILYKKLCKQYNVPFTNLEDILISKEDLNIVFTSSQLQPYAKKFNSSFKFVGPAISSRTEDKKYLEKVKTSGKIIYISIGTIFNDNLKFFQTCINALGNTKYQVIISLGEKINLSDLPPIPSNILVKNYVSQLDVLKISDVFITHAGMNSISESMYYGVPMIAVPQIHEQILNAIRVQQVGTGIYIPNRKLTTKKLMRAVEEILNNNKYKDNAKKIGESFRKAGGYKRAVDEIINFAKDHKIKI